MNNDIFKCDWCKLVFFSDEPMMRHICILDKEVPKAFEKYEINVAPKSVIDRARLLTGKKNIIITET